jgi:hypothetical protein
MESEQEPIHEDLERFERALAMLRRITSVLAEHGVTGGRKAGGYYMANYGMTYGDPRTMCVATRLVTDVDDEGVDLSQAADEAEQEEILENLPMAVSVNCALLFGINSQVGVSYDVVTEEWFCFLGRLEDDKPIAPDAMAFGRSVGIEKVCGPEDDAEKIDEARAWEIITAIADRRGQGVKAHDVAAEYAKKLGVNVTRTGASSHN